MKIELKMGEGRSIVGELIEETDQFYRVNVIEVIGSIGKRDWNKGDKVTIGKLLVKQIKEL